MAAHVLLAAALTAAAQPKDEGFHEVRKAARLSDAEAVRAFEAPDGDGYTLGEGDEITLEVWGRPEISGKHIVGPDGKITVPVAGTIRVAELTREGAAAVIRKALAPYYVEPAVNLRVDRYTSSRIFILGRVTHAGALQFENPPTLLEAITRAGSLPVGGMGAEKAALTRCAVFRGRERVIWIDLKSLLTQGNLALNLRLRRNDLVYIPDADDQLIYVLGEVQRPGALRLTPDMSFLDAFAQAGGASADGAAGKIHLIRPATGAHREFAFSELMKPRSELNVSLEEGDIIYVAPKFVARVGYWMQKISPLTGFVLLGTALPK